MAAPVLNPAMRIDRRVQGSEREPVLVIDDCLADPDGWRTMADAGDYTKVGPHYPGVRAFIPRDPVDQLRDELASVLAETFALDPVPQVHEAYFSIVTTAPANLAPIQRLPHFDGFEASRIAVLIYLSGAAAGGTAFYRQRETGFETVDEGRFAAFRGALDAGVARHGLPDAAYIAGDTPLFEEVAAYEARPNRALIYRSRTLHCARIAAHAALPADPRTGRLSINAFLFDDPRW